MVCHQSAMDRNREESEKQMLMLRWLSIYIFQYFIKKGVLLVLPTTPMSNTGTIQS